MEIVLNSYSEFLKEINSFVGNEHYRLIRTSNDKCEVRFRDNDELVSILTYNHNGNSDEINSIQHMSCDRPLSPDTKIMIT